MLNKVVADINVLCPLTVYGVLCELNSADVIGIKGNCFGAIVADFTKYTS